MITRRLSVVRIWRRFAFPTELWTWSDTARASAISVRASDSFTFSDAATHS